MITKQTIEQAANNLEGIVVETPLTYNPRLSRIHAANIFVKEEHKQPVRSYKIRGALNMMLGLSEEEKRRGVVCASAGNHSQGFAFAANYLGIDGVVFMPKGTPRQKRMRTEEFGNGHVSIVAEGSNFDEAYAAAIEYAEKTGAVMVPPFNNEAIIAGQGTVALEIARQYGEMSSQYGSLDAIVVPIGGGGLISGVSTYFEGRGVRIYGVESFGASAMKESLKNGRLTTLETIDTTVDGMAVKTPGSITYDIVSRLVDVHDIYVVPEGAICKELIDYHNHEGEELELAGVASVSALNYIEGLKGKNVACILSGGNVDFSRGGEIERKSLEHQKLFVALVINMPNIPGQGKAFFEMQAPDTNIDVFNFAKSGPVYTELLFQNPAEYDRLLESMNRFGWTYTIQNM